MQPTQKPIKKFTPELNNKLSVEYYERISVRQQETILKESFFKSASGVKVQTEKKKKISNHLHFIL